MQDLNLKLDWCSFQAAKFACENWHYSKSMPAGKLTRIGVWEDGKYIGCVIFGRGANNNLAKSFGLFQTECIELVRIALTDHKTPVTKIVSIAIRMLRKLSSGIRLIVSYADWTNQKHQGKIYQAGNWLFLGERKSSNGAHWIIDGKLVHNRSVSAKFGSRSNIPEAFKSRMRPAPPQVKFLFVYVLDKTLRQELESKAVGFQPAEGGAVPTLTHQK